MNILLADSGATQSEWCLMRGRTRKSFSMQGISPYFLDSDEIEQIIRTELYPALGNYRVDKVYYYGTGCAGPANKKIVRRAIRQFFLHAEIYVDHDLMGAAIALCGSSRGIVCNLGTGSFSCYFDGNKILKSSPGLGYVLGDEGSGAYLGKKVLQHYLYGIFDEKLRYKFDEKYATTALEILERVYKMAFPNRYLASFALFLAENRGHDLVEAIIRESLEAFFRLHVLAYTNSRKVPVHFVGSVAFGFQDVIHDLISRNALIPGKLMRRPMEGLVQYYSNQK
jgi:N-acetylglucosamine kinase-like BadF-type ATPase